jgi:hypothetical protein
MDNRDRFADYDPEVAPPGYGLSTIEMQWLGEIGLGPQCSFYYWEEGEPSIYHHYEITFAEFYVCEEQLNQKGAELGFECFLP